MNKLLILIVSISFVASCSTTNTFVREHDVCYGLQGEVFEDCILRHRR